uniref:Uncharacterized protein n=1 Tax=Picea glauca TaxID=3330 RepID=A0A101M3W9_PICGL|nr:hypothetical protein ABT39_MTgene455 [Picea glauca]QHR88185.1 hypothetical protein Q903MT_gene2198 [Picea sitchensis]
MHAGPSFLSPSHPPAPPVVGFHRARYQSAVLLPLCCRVVLTAGARQSVASFSWRCRVRPLGFFHSPLAPAVEIPPKGLFLILFLPSSGAAVTLIMLYSRGEQQAVFE